MSDRAPDLLWNKITLLLLAANFLFGVAIIAILPPFEGMDETAHFSRLQSQVFAPPSSFSQDKKDDVNTHISMDVYTYYRRGPMPYQWIDFEDLHAKDPLRGYTTYHDFFEQPQQRVADYEQAYQQTPLSSGYNPGPEPNWQYQHPGLYYAITGQILKLLARHASLITTVFILRLFSYLMAFTGFCIGLYATRTSLEQTGIPDAYAITALGAFYPFLAPEFFWEFARIGNDSMCLLFFGITWALVLRHIRALRSDAWLYLGFCLGLSMLVKALMIPVAVGLLGFLALHHFLVVRKDPDYTDNWWVAPLKIAGVMILIGAPIYLGSYIHKGSIGAVNFTGILHTPDAWSLLRQNFAWPTLLSNILGIIQTAVWLFGSWSLIIIDIPIHRALDVFTVMIVFLYVLAVRGKTGALFRLPLWPLLPLFIGLLGNILVTFILQNKDATPGYYLHILAPALALIYGLGLNRGIGKRWSKIVMTCVCGPVLVLNFFIAWSYMTVFSGCAIPTRIEYAHRLLHPANVFHCAGQFNNVIARLKILAWPDLALASIGSAFILLAVAGILTLSATQMKKVQEHAV